MELSRRRFFGLMGGVVAAKVAAPIFVLAPPSGWDLSASGLVSPKLYSQKEWECAVRAEQLESFAFLIPDLGNYFDKLFLKSWYQHYRIPMKVGV